MAVHGAVLLPLPVNDFRTVECSRITKISRRRSKNRAHLE